MRRLAVALPLVFLLPGLAAAGDRELLNAKARYLTPARSAFADTPDGVQARYDAGRDLVEGVRAAGGVSTKLRPVRDELLRIGRRQVARAEALDRPDGSRGTGRLASLPPAVAPRGAHRPDAALRLRLELATRSFDGWAAAWVHNLRTGRFAAWNGEERFPAASTVKLGALVAALRTSVQPERGRWWYDARQIGAWSSNLGANRISGELGLAAVSAALRRLGMRSSTYPGPYRATTGYRPPGGHTRVTTVFDLGRALYRLHATAYGDRSTGRLLGLSQAQAQAGLRILLSAQRASDNLGLLRPWLGDLPVAEKNGWLSDTRLTAAIVYERRGPTIVVVAAYRPGVSAFEARQLGRRVLAVAGVNR